MDVVLTTNELFPLVCSRTNVPVVEIEPTIADFMRSLDIARRFGDVIGILGWSHKRLGTSVEGCTGFRMLDVMLKCMPFENDEEARTHLEQAARNGLKVVIIQDLAWVEEAQALGIKVIPLGLSSEAIQKAVRYAQSLALYGKHREGINSSLRDCTNVSDSALLKDDTVRNDDSFSTIVTQAPVMIEVIQKSRRIARTAYPVLITGETGTGKELLAQGIHAASRRKNRPLVSINCATLHDTLIDSELFGYDNGSFTGGLKGGKDGACQAANGGTVFLDELSSASFGLQAKLLRVIEQGEVRPVGGAKPSYVDVRIIAATNEPIEKLLATGRLREDLYYRLNVGRLHVPPLRHRQGDVAVLVKRFATMCADEMSLPVKEFCEQALAVLENYEWPGNVRELLNMVRRTYLMVDSTQVGLREIRVIMDDLRQPFTLSSPIDQDYAETCAFLNSVSQKAKTNAVLRALEITDGNQTEAASLLGVSRTTVWRYVRNLRDNGTEQCLDEGFASNGEI
jgi:transcriptional regulator with PAS, ATPase and Fis domain